MIKEYLTVFIINTLIFYFGFCTSVFLFEFIFWALSRLIEHFSIYNFHWGLYPFLGIVASIHGIYSMHEYKKTKLPQDPNFVKYEDMSETKKLDQYLLEEQKRKK